MQQIEAPTPEDSPANRRAYARLPVVTAVQLSVGDAQAHAVVLDASLGGLRLQLAGVAARLFHMPTSLQTQELQVGILFLQHGLRELGILQANVRWVRPDAQGCTVGLQLLADSHAQQARVLEVLQADETRIAQRRQRLGAVTVGLVLLAMAVMLAQHLDETEMLQNHLTVMTQQTQGLHESLLRERNRVQEQTRRLQALRDDLNACQSQEEADGSAHWVDVSEGDNPSTP